MKLKISFISCTVLVMILVLQHQISDDKDSHLQEERPSVVTVTRDTTAPMPDDRPGSPSHDPTEPNQSDAPSVSIADQAHNELPIPTIAGVSRIVEGLEMEWDEACHELLAWSQEQGYCDSILRHETLKQEIQQIKDLCRVDFPERDEYLEKLAVLEAETRSVAAQLEHTVAEMNAGNPDGEWQPARENARQLAIKLYNHRSQLRDPQKMETIEM